MILDDKTKDRPTINYPCEWGFKIIGRDKEKLQKSIFDIMAHRDYKCREGNVSSRGKFVSINASCEVSSEKERDELFKAFQEHRDVNMVI